MEETPIKGLLLGNSGAGKTGALASLAIAGYRLWIIDFDSGTNILRHLLKDHPNAQVQVKRYADVYGGAPNVVPKKVQAWSQALNQVTKWSTEHNTLEDILVIDSLNFASKFAFNWILQLAGRLNAPKEIQDWGAVQTLMEAFLMQLYSEETKSHVLMLSHISYQGQGESDIKMGFPMTSVGRSFNPQIGRFFNNVFLVRNTGTGPASKREIWTSPVDYVDLKAETLTLKSHYPLTTGMADIFKEIRGVVPVGTTPESPALPKPAVQVARVARPILAKT